MNMYQQYIYMYQQHQTWITVSTTTYNNNQNLKEKYKEKQFMDIHVLSTPVVYRCSNKTIGHLSYWIKCKIYLFSIWIVNAKELRHRLITVEHTVESFILWKGISMGSVPKCVIQELGGSTFQNMWCPQNQCILIIP